MKNWYKLYATRNLAEASIIKGVLEENSVPVFVIDKQGSTQLNFGYIELYVPSHLKDIAKNLVEQGLMN
jgi:hypothetical protein